MNSEDAHQTVAMIDEKASTVLSKNEWKTFLQYRLAYTQRRVSIHQFVHHLLKLLNTPAKITLLTEIREMVLDEDLDIFDQTTFHSEQPWFEADHVEYNQWFEEEWSQLFSSTSVYRQTQNNLGFQMNDAETYLQVDARHKHELDARHKSKQDEGFHACAYPLAEVQLGVQVHQPTSPRKTSFPRLSLNVQRPASSPFPLAKISEQSARVQEKRDRSLIRVPKTQPMLGIAIEGGIDTPHIHPRIISIHAKGAAFETVGLSVGQSLVEVDGFALDGLCHEEVAKTISTCFQDKSKPYLTLLVQNSPHRGHLHGHRS